MVVQRDLISEGPLLPVIGDDPRLRNVADQLIEHASKNYAVKAYWITDVTGYCAQTLSLLRESGTILAYNVGAKKHPRWRYDIVSFMAWYKTRKSV